MKARKRKVRQETKKSNGTTTTTTTNDNNNNNDNNDNAGPCRVPPRSRRRWATRGSSPQGTVV